MTAILTPILQLMPVWFGLLFVGPVLAEVITRSPLSAFLPTDTASMLVGLSLYQLCMIFGGLYGLVAFKTGRWI
ncbi:hypothetical protein N9566_00350 [bacterium]|nr:hypothetical protein [bacterium]